MKSLKNRLDKLESGGSEWDRLKEKFFWHFPIVTSPSGEIHNPVNPEDEEDFQRFLEMAGERNFMASFFERINHPK